MYNMFLSMLTQLLEMFVLPPRLHRLWCFPDSRFRSPEFDLNALYSLHDRITQLREARGIRKWALPVIKLQSDQRVPAPPSPVQSDFADPVEYGIITSYRDIVRFQSIPDFARVYQADFE